MEMGFKSRNNVRLTEGAVPSVQSLSLSAASAAASGGASANAGNAGAGTERSSSASTKRWLFSILSEDDEALTKEIMNEPDEDFTTDSLPRTIDQALQCNIRLPYRSSGVQVKPTLISIGTQTEEDIHSTTTAINHVTSTPVKNDEEDEQSSFDFDSHQWDSSWSIEEEEMDTDTSEEEAQDEEQRNTK
uniref:Uncharacterized protein n=1 Tax=Knipowitschia caucasica TaxID=637954 RepID=A0AAV2IUP5_KNICA